MKRFHAYLFTTAIGLLLLDSQTANAQARMKGQVMRPESSIEKPGDISLRFHTNLLIYSPGGGQSKSAVSPSELPPVRGLFFETPASIACVYRLVDKPIRGCSPDVTTENPSGGSGAIAIVDAFDDPRAAGDLAHFSAQFGLPPADFQVVFAQGSRPPQDPTGGWEIEESLDIEWAHAMAPHAKIFLVEAADNSGTNLFNAVILASFLVVQNGGGEVSMSWGSTEFAEEAELDPFFGIPGVVYLAASGDGPGAQYPSASPNVVSAGGTSISRNTETGRFLLENTWQDAGSGPSIFEPRPKFQDRIQRIVGGQRGTPDFSFDANPFTGVWVYDSNAVPGPGWYILGGTSVSAPSLAGIINAAGSFHISSQAENEQLYRGIGNPFVLRDIRYGTCGLNMGDFSGFGWDFCTGVGSDIGLHGK
jgi:kumamolisin